MQFESTPRGKWKRPLSVSLAAYLLATFASSGHAAPSVRTPPLGTRFDYQLGGSYTPHAAVGIVTRDRADTPAPGLYNICYINGFQTQPGEEAWWLSLYPDLILRDSGGNPVRDPNWDELLFDLSTANKRGRLASIVGTWIADCAAKGFAAIDVDNLDSFTRSGGRLNADHAVAYMALLSPQAHALGLAVSQKNAPELLPRKAAMGTDFAVVESCDCWQECGVYTPAYCSVLAIEYPSSECPSGYYDSNSFLAGCNRYPQIVRLYRDVALSTPGSAGYLYLTCPALPQVDPRCQSRPVPALPGRWLFANVALIAWLVARAGHGRGRRRRC